MHLYSYGLKKIAILILFALTSPFAVADDDSVSINAGADQVVNAGDTTYLSASVSLEKDNNRDKKHHRRDKDKKDKRDLHKHKRSHGHDKDRHKHKHKRHGHDDDYSLSWSQTAGTVVTLLNSDSLNPSFVAPTPTMPTEVLEFTLAVYDDDGELITSDAVNITVHVPTSSVLGRITAVDGSVIEGVSIKVLSAANIISTTSSDVSGRFSASLAADHDVVLHLSATGFADQVVPLKTPAALSSQFFDFTMIARGTEQAFAADANASLYGDDGASVSVLASSFVDQNGLPVSGNINLTITPVDVSRPASLAAFPGEFSGVLEGAAGESPIVSFGTVEFEFSQNGNPLQLAPGQTADVLIPIYIATYQDGSTVNIGDSIPLWSLNEETGIWQQEGVGTVVASTGSPTGLAMQATVSHFSWWNCDVSMNAAQAIVTVYGPNTGSALIKARTLANIGWRPTTVETVSPVGIPTSPLYIPSNGEVCFWADITFDDGSTGSTLEQCLTAAPGSLISVDLILPIAGPVNISSSPAATAGVLDVTGYLGYVVPPVQIKSTTYETTVSYSIISGSLPAGLSLNSVNATRADIVGTVTQSGDFSVVVQGTDADGTSDIITINYHISTDTPPPELEYAFVSYTDVPNSYDLTVFDLAGSATSWSLSENIISENGPPPASISLDPATGILTITDYCIFWEGNLTASNSSGSSTNTIYVENWGCW